LGKGETPEAGIDGTKALTEWLPVTLAECCFHGVHRDGYQEHGEEVGHEKGTASVGVEQVREPPYVAVAYRVANASQPVLKRVAEGVGWRSYVWISADFNLLWVSGKVLYASTESLLV